MTMRKHSLGIWIVTFLGLAALPALAQPADPAAAKSPQAAVVLANQKAIASGDLEGYKKTVLTDVAKQFEGEQGKTLWSMLSKGTPTTDLEFLKLSVKGDDATLQARGKRAGVPQRGEISLKLEGGSWRVGRASWEPEKK